MSIFELCFEMTCFSFQTELKHTSTIYVSFMDNKVLADIIREKYYEQKMTSDYKLQLNKVVEMEDNFLKDFSKDKWKEYLFLDIEKGQLHSLEVDHIIEFVIKFLIKD